MKNILVVDDNEMDLQMVSVAIESLGFHVLTANGGYKALDCLETEDVDLILLDLSMPVMSGLDLLRRLKRSSKNRTTPILMLSGRSQKAAVQSALKAGADGFLVKPINLGLHKSKIMNHLIDLSEEAA